MKLNLIGPSCVGKTTLAKIIARKNNWQHFDLDLIFIDHDYLAQTKLFRYRTKADYQKKIRNILSTNKDWVIEGVYAVEEVFKEADMIVLIKLPMMISLKWQWKRYFTDQNQRDTYGLFNNFGLTKEIIFQYLKRCNVKDFSRETSCYVCKYSKMLEKYKDKLKVINKVEDLEILKKNGSCSFL